MTSYPTSKENTLDNYTEIDKIQSKQDNKNATTWANILMVENGKELNVLQIGLVTQSSIGMIKV